MSSKVEENNSQGVYNLIAWHSNLANFACSSRASDRDTCRASGSRLNCRSRAHNAYETQEILAEDVLAVRFSRSADILPCERATQRFAQKQK